MTRRAAFDLFTLLGASLTTLAVELALVERKFGVFGGGFGTFQVIDTPGEFAAFALGLLVAHLTLMIAIFVVVRRLHRRDRPALIRYDFLAVAVGVFTATLIAKFEVLAYFSDAISFQLIRNLGGGSLFDAFLFALNDGALLIGGAVVAVLGWWLVRRAIARRAQIDTTPGPRLRRPFGLLVIALPFVVWGCDRLPDPRYALARTTAFALADDALEQLTDFDRDGYSLYSSQLDRAPFDAGRHPLALDIPNNGIDEDGLGGDLTDAVPDPVTAPPRLTAGRNLVMVVLESTRADLIGKRVNGRLVAPNLTALAAAGSSFPQAYTHVGYTTASLKSLFSGQLDPRVGDPSLFTDLKRSGYRIAVFSGQPESFGEIAETVGMKRSADIFVDAETLKDERAFSFAAKGSLLIDESKLLREFDRSLGDPAGWRRPTFVYFNFQSAHFPYNHPGLPDTLGIAPLPRDAITRANQPRVAQTYWNAVAYSDRKLGELIARLKTLGVWDNTLLMVTGDHGEALFDDGYLGHGHVIDRQQTHIPLVLNVPGRATAAPLGLKDIRAILLAELGGAPAPTRTRPSFLHIGPLDAPVAIGMVDPGGVFTTMILDTEEVRFGTDTRARYGTLTGAARARADRLIAEWGRQRWAHHLSGGN